MTRKILILLALSPALMFPAAQSPFPIMVGFLSGNIPGASTFALSTAAAGGFSQSWLALSFQPDSGRTVSKIRVFASAVAGTLASTDLVCDIYSDSAGSPSSSLASSSTVTSTPTGAAIVEFTGFSLALTAGQQYWVVLRNANATPTTNFPTYRFGLGGGASTIVGGTNPSVGWAKKQSTDGGSTWAASTAANVWGLRISYADGTFQGEPFTNEANSYSTSDRVFSGQEEGVKLTTPSGVTLNVIGASMYVGYTGTPTGSIRFRLYNGNTLLATSSAALPRTQLQAAGALVTAYFPSVQSIAPGTTIRLTKSETSQSDSSGNYYSGLLLTIDGDANSEGLMPFGAEQTLTATGGNGATFTDSATVVEPFILLLDTNTPFTSSGSGGATVSHIAF